MAANPYEEQLGGRDAVQIIGQTPGELRQLLQALGADGLGRSLAPDKWPARMIFCHLADTEIAFAFRLRQALAEEAHVIQPFDQDAWARRYGNLEAEEAVEVFTALRVWNLRLIEGVSGEEWRRKLSHPERGEMDFKTLVETMAGHDLNHRGQLEELAGAGIRK